MRNKPLKILAQVAVLAALALIIKMVTSQAFLFQGVWVRFNVAATVSQMVPVIFGPVWGAMSNAVIDILNFFISQPPPYLPHITVLEVLSGMALGVLWKVVRMDNKTLKMLTVTLAVDVPYTLLNTIAFFLLATTPQTAPLMAAILVRTAVAVVIAIPKAYIMTLLLNIYSRHIKEKI